MKVQLKEIVLAVPALSKLSAGDLQLRLAYKLKRMISALQKEADFFAEQRQKIFEKYGTAKADGSFDFSAENEPKAAAELEELLEMEVIPEVEAIDIDERAAELKTLLKGYKNVSGSMKRTLQDLGFTISEEGKHYKLTYYGDSRYMITLAKTPSDGRSGLNIVTTIIKNML